MSVCRTFSDEIQYWEPTVVAGEKDRSTLRDLARRVAEIAALEIQKEKAALWRAHNSLKPTRPLMLARPENGWVDLVPESELQCEDPRLRVWETTLRRLIFRHENIHDDWPVTNHFNIAWVMSFGDYGLKETVHHSEAIDGSFSWDPPVKTEEDFNKLKFREVLIDRENTKYKVNLARDILGDLLEVRIHGRLFITLGMTATLVFLRGMEEAMMDMMDRPEFMHRMMGFLRDATLHEIEFFEREGYLLLNNEDDDWIGAGGVAATDELPAPDFNGKVRLKDLWVFSESQEFVGVGPKQFKEFVFPYQLPIMKKFGLVSYGCCEPLDRKFDMLIENVPNLRRLSVSPWCDRKIAAEKLQDRYVYSFKPNPAMICGPTPDYKAAENLLRETLEIAKGCRFEAIMKDTHTFHHEPERIKEWTLMASRLAEEYADKYA